MHRRILVTCLSAILLGLFMTACTGGKATEQLIEERANERWQALIKGDLKTAYTYYSKAFRETTPYKHFEHRVRGVGLWSHAAVKSVECNEAEKRCKVWMDVAVVTKMRGLDKPIETSTLLEETWIQEGVMGNWYFIKR